MACKEGVTGEGKLKDTKKRKKKRRKENNELIEQGQAEAGKVGSKTQVEGLSWNGR